MRIAIDMTALAYNFSGIERYALNIAKNILETDKENDYILFFCNCIHEEFVAYINRENVESRIVCAGKSRLCKLYLFQVQLPHILNKTRADCYIFPAFAPPVMFCKKDIIMVVHDVGYFDCPNMWKKYISLYGRIKIRAGIRHSSLLIAVSEFTKRRVIDLFDVDPSKILVSYNSIDSRFNKALITEETKKELLSKYCINDENYILCLSTLEPRKNTKLLLDAYCELVKEGRINNSLVLAGRSGWKIKDLLYKIDHSDTESIYLTGFIDDSDLPGIYKMARLFVFPSIYEGFGIPPLEALSCGTKVLVSDLPVFKEVLGERVCYFKNNDINDLKNMILMCIGNPISDDILDVSSSWRESAQIFVNAIKKYKKREDDERKKDNSNR